MANFQIKVVQRNSKNEISFVATSNTELRESDTIADFAKDVSNFCKDICDFKSRSKERGLNLAGLSKTGKVELSLTAIDTENSDLNCTLSFKNFGKFCEKSTLQNLTNQIEDSANFTLTYSNWSKLL